MAWLKSRTSLAYKNRQLPLSDLEVFSILIVGTAKTPLDISFLADQRRMNCLGRPRIARRRLELGEDRKKENHKRRVVPLGGGVF